MEPLICRTLRREYRFHVPDEAARKAFGFMQVDPEIEGIALEVKDVEISRRSGFWRLVVPDEIVIEGTARHLIWEIYRFVFRDINHTHRTSPMVHAATLRMGDKRIAIAGGKGFGKTTLMLSLLANGHRIDGDEHIVLEADSVITRPRTLRVKEGSFNVVPDAAAAIFAQPRVELWDGGYVYSVSPRLFGGEWRIARGQLDAVVFLEANHGGRSVMKPLTAAQQFERLMRHVILQGEAVPQQFARIRSLATQLPAFSLRLGDLQGAQFHLERIGMP